MADISQIKSPDNTVYDIKDATARDILDKQVHMYYVVGPSTDTTAGTWTGTIEGLTAYYEGLTVLYVPAVAGASTTKLNINGLGAVQCFYTGTTALTTHYAVGTPILLTYRTIGTTAGWRRADYNSNTTYYVFTNLCHYTGAFVADSAVYRCQLLFHVDENRLTPLNNVSNNIGTSKTILTDVEFDPFGEIFYYASTTNVAANGDVPGTYLCFAHGDVDLRYSLNISNTVNPLTAKKDVYIKVSPQANGKVKLAAAYPIVQDLPTTNDGYWYIYFGRSHTDTKYKTPLYPHHPVFYHNGTNLVQKLPTNSDSTTVNGHTVAANVPSDAVFTDTTYSSLAAASGGTDVSLVTTGEKYTWNNKPSIGTTSSTAFRGDYGNSAYAHAVTNKGSAFASGLYKITTNSEGHVTAATAVVKSDLTGLGVADENGAIWYGVCDTAAATQAKTVTITGFPTAYAEGMNVRIRFANAQDYNGVPTLNINSIGAVAIKQYWDNNAARYEWGAGEIIDFCYSNARWLLVRGTRASTSTYGRTILINSTSSTSTTGAATPNSVKQAYDLASSKQNAVEVIRLS